MAISRLVVDYDYDFILIALVSAAKEYKLAWDLDKKLQIELVKLEDLELDFVNDKQLVISNFEHQEDAGGYRLLKNKAVEVKSVSKPFLLPELKEFDYLLQIEGVFVDEIEETLEHLSQLASIQYYKEVEVENLKSKDNLLY